MATPFTKETLSKLLDTRGLRLVIHDPRTPGLRAELRPGGQITFYVVKRPPSGKPVRKQIGKFPALTIDQARSQAQQELAIIARGADPNQALRMARKAPTLKELFDEFVELPTRTKSKRPKSAKTVHDYRLQFNGYLKDWQNRQISTITRGDVEKLHNHLAKSIGNHTANRVLALIKALLNTAIDLGYLTGNVAARLMAFEEQSRERFLQADELPKFWAAVEAEPSEKIRDFIKLALFTGQRRSNVLAMRWENVDLQRGVWFLPKTKTGRHEVPLTVEAIEVLKRRKDANGDSEFVLPGHHGREHLRDPMTGWRAILERAGIDDLRIHDLRRSLGSWQAITGASLPVIGKTLGHSQPSTTAVYSRLSDDPVRSAMGTATATMMKLAKPEPDKPTTNIDGDKSSKPKRTRKAKGGANNG